jgi:sRNA-binding protein
MIYRFTREETEAAIVKLAELYPACFFVEAHQRRPLVKTILSDLEKDGVPMSFEQIKAAVDWYHSSWGYLRSVKAGVKRINMFGEERVAVTAAEERYSAQRLRDEKRAKEEKESYSHKDVKATPMVKKPLPQPPTPTPPLTLPVTASPPPAPTKDPFGYLLRVVEDARRAHQTFPEAMRRPMIAPTLRAIDIETQRLIADIEKESPGSE